MSEATPTIAEMIEMVEKYNPPPSIANVPVRKSKIELMLPPGLHELAKLAPTNPTVRAGLMSLVGQLPPTEADTYEKIKDWIEFNFDKPVGLETSPDPHPLWQVAPEPTPPPNVAFQVDVEFTDTEYGRCRYSVDRTGGGLWNVTEEQIRRALARSTTIGDAVVWLVREIRSNAWDEIDPDMDCNWEEESTDDHESSDTDNSDTSVDRDQVLNQLKAWAIEHLPPDERIALGITV